MTRMTTVLEGRVQTPLAQYSHLLALSPPSSSFVTLYHHYAAIYVYTIYFFVAFVAKCRSAIY